MTFCEYGLDRQCPMCRDIAVRQAGKGVAFLLLLLGLLLMFSGCGSPVVQCPYVPDRVLDCGVSVAVDHKRGPVATWVDDTHYDLQVCLAIAVLEEVAGVPPGTLAEQGLLIVWTGPGWPFDAEHMSAGGAYAAVWGWERSWVYLASWYQSDPSACPYETALLHEVAHVLRGPDERMSIDLAEQVSVRLRGAIQ